MREKAEGLVNVRAISGTYVVFLALNMKEADTKGLMGFAIQRTDLTEDETTWLRGNKTFASIRPSTGIEDASSHEHPFQAFQWADYSAKPGYRYCYRVIPMYGKPGALTEKAETRVTIGTEPLSGGTHDVHFNRGAIASQAFAKRFPGLTLDQAGAKVSGFGARRRRSRSRLLPSSHGIRAAMAICVLAQGICCLASQSAPDGEARRRIVSILRDTVATPEQKVLQLTTVKGTLTGDDAVAVGQLLYSSSGDVLVAIGDAMVRCGAGRVALESMLAIAKERDRPIAQFAPALAFVGKNALEISGKAWERFVDGGAQALVDRLREPKDQEELLNTLRSRDFIWQPGTGFGSRDRVVRQLCALLNDPNHEVRQEAARDLAGTAAAEYVPGSAVLPLVAVLQEADDATARAIARLLEMVLGTGPESDEVSRIKAFWAEWAEKAGKGFDLTNYLLARADSDRGLSLNQKHFLGWQVLYASRELPLDGREKAWRRLRKIFEDDPSAVPLRVRAWYKTLIHMAERERGSPIRAEALSLLIKLTQDQEPEMRAFSLSLFGEMEGTMAPGSEPRLILQRALQDSKATPEERALAAWSLRKALKGAPALVEQMVKLGEYLQACPESAFKFMAQGHCIGQIAGAVSQALDIRLGPDTSEWRKALADFLPRRK